ncbi:MAG: putative cardiolipin synthase [Halioglobus sp.]
MLKKILILGAFVSSGACAALPPNHLQIPSYSFTDTQDTPLAKEMSRHHYGQTEGGTGVYFLRSGTDAFVACAGLADRAARSIDAQYYLFHRDVTGRILLQRMLAAAERGVRVRLLVDDMDLADLDEDIAMVDSHPNFEVRIWNPFIREHNRTAQLLTHFGSVTRRMHNKSFTIDNQLSIVGGRNIGDEYFEADPEYVFGDLDVALIGKAAGQVSESFDSYWNHELAYPISALHKGAVDKAARAQAERNLEAFVALQKGSDYARALKNSELVEKILRQDVSFNWASAEVYADDPDKILRERDRKEGNVFRRLLPHLVAAQKELTIISPYFVPGKKGTKTLSDMAARGVRIRMLTNSYASTDVTIVHAAYSRYRKELLRNGVELYEMDSHAQVIKRQEPKKELSPGQSKSSLHAKYLIIDREKTFVGSLNFDPRSVVENTEIGVLIYDKDVSSELDDNFGKRIAEIAFKLTLSEQGDIVWHQQKSGELSSFETEPNTSFWDRFTLGFMRLLPGESQL